MCPKSGKTTLSYKLFGEKALILGFEQGYGLLKGVHAVPVNDYKTLQNVMKQLKNPKVQEKYDVLVFDTADLFHLVCEKYLCAINGVSSIGEIGSMGAGYQKLDNIVNNILLQIASMGYKMFFISHATQKKVPIMTTQGEIEVEKYFPSVAKRTYQIISKFVDNIFYISMEVGEDGKVVRKLYTRDNKISFGGTRMEHLPSVLPLDVDVLNREFTKALELAGGDINVAPMVADYTVEKLDFETVKNELVNLVQSKFVPANRLAEVKAITEKHLGIGATIGTANEYQVEALAVILDELKGL